MTLFTLTVNIKPGDLQTLLDASELVTIVFGVSAIVTSTQAAAAPHHVVWLAFDPMEKNPVSWSGGGYLLYASSSCASGQVLTMQTQTAALETMALTFDGSFGGPDGTALPRNTFGVANKNETASSMVFGLGLAANVAGNAVVSPINASVVPKNQFAQFTPTNVVGVFMQTSTANGMVITNPIGTAPAFAFSERAPSISITYDAALGAFVSDGQIPPK